MVQPNPWRLRLLRLSAAAIFLWATACGLRSEEDEREVGARILHSAPLTDVAFSPDGRILATASEDDTVRLLDVTALAGGTGGPPSTIIIPEELPSSPIFGYGGGVGAIAFSPDSASLALSSRDVAYRDVVGVFGVATGDPLDELVGDGGPIVGLDYRSDGAAIAAGGGYPYEQAVLELWDTTTAPAALTQLTGAGVGPMYDVEFSPDGSMLAAAYGDGTVRLFSTDDWQLLRELHADGHVPHAIAFSPDGAYLATAGDDGGTGFDGVGAIVRLWRVADSVVRDYNLGNQVLHALAFAPDGAAFAAAGESHVISVVDIESGQLLCELKGHSDTVRALAFSPDGTLLASGADDQFLRIWDVDDLIGEPPGDGGPDDGGPDDGGADDAGIEDAGVEGDAGPDGGSDSGVFEG